MALRKTLTLLLALTLLALPLSSLASGQPSTLYVTTQSGSGVHMRSQPDTSDDSNIIMTVPYGAAVSVNTIMADVPFADVTYKGNTGYMEMDYLSTTPPPPKPSGGGDSGGNSGGGNSGGGSSSSGNSALQNELSSLYAGFVITEYEAVVMPTSDYVNLRWAPTLDAPVRIEYYEGTLLQVLSDNGTWSEVYDAHARISGYMETQFLQLAPSETQNVTDTNTQG